MSHIRKGDAELKAAWGDIFRALPLASRLALRDALLRLREHAQANATTSWRRHKAPMALYWKVVAVYAGHLARSLRETRGPQKWGPR